MEPRSLPPWRTHGFYNLHQSYNRCLSVNNRCRHLLNQPPFSSAPPLLTITTGEEEEEEEGTSWWGLVPVWVAANRSITAKPLHADWVIFGIRIVECCPLAKCEMDRFN